MLVIVLIASTMMISALPAFLRQQENKHLQAQLVQAIHFAQDQAILQQQNIDLKASQTKLQVMMNEQLLLQIPLKHYGHLYWRSYPNYRDYFRFGMMQNDNGSFWFCERNKLNPSWALTLNAMGQIRLLVANKSGSILDHTGHALTCVS